MPVDELTADVRAVTELAVCACVSARVDMGMVATDRARAEIREIALGARCGHGSTVSVQGGEKGSRSRIVAEGIALAGIATDRVIWYPAAPSGESSRYWPWIGVIQQYVMSARRVELDGQLREIAAVVADVVPELRDRIPDLPPAEYPYARYAEARRVFALASFIVDASWRDELVVVVENPGRMNGDALGLQDRMVRTIGTSRLMIVLVE